MIKNQISDMIKKARTIDDLRKICNTILANGCYHTKELTTQIAKAEKSGNLTDKERDVIEKAWDFRSKKAHEIMKDLEEFIDNEKKQDEKDN